MSLAESISTLNIKIAGIPLDTADLDLERVLIRTIQIMEQYANQFISEIPKASGSLRSSFKVETSIYGEKSITIDISSPYAQYVLEFGRIGGTRPPWDRVKTWAITKGVPIAKARAWWYSKGADPKDYKSPSGRSLKGWWTRKTEQFKQRFRVELNRQLQTAGFDLNQISLRF
jgi:hypothetical protein